MPGGFNCLFSGNEITIHHKMQQLTRYLKFPVQFDESQLLKDLSDIMDSAWVPHFNTGGYSGNWNAIPLYSQNGEAGNIFAIMDPDVMVSETPIMKNCNYFREVLSWFQFPILSVRLLKLEAGAEIKPHRDHELGYEDGQFRLHIPIVTNPDVEFILDGEQIRMLPGECWYTNVNLVHSVSNRGTIDRVHLVIDGVRNEWTDGLFFTLAPEESFEKKVEQNWSPETMQRMLEELKQNGFSDEHPLVLELRGKLGQ